MQSVAHTHFFASILTLLLLMGLPVFAGDITQGVMRYTVPDTGEINDLPLEHTDARVLVTGTVAEVTVTQTFSNPLDDRLEAVYSFPLPDRAAVDDMSIRVGERLVRGEIHRREEAREIYEEARAQGRLTGLLDQERPNIFTQSVANILPGETIEVVIHYVEDLHFDHGIWRLVFPTVVGPRYIPGKPTGRLAGGWSPDTDRVPDGSRITPPVLAPGERSGHDITITVELAPGFVIQDLASSSHEIVTSQRGRKRAFVRLAPRDTMPNKDFVLSWSTASAVIEPAVLTHRTEHEGYLSLILQPPAQPRIDQVVPREVVFVLDSSGSMSGEPMAACKQLVRKALRQLQTNDTFRLIRFAGDANQFDPAALPANRINLERALSWLDGMRGGGGTEMLAGVQAALEAPTDPYRLRLVLFLTDGFIGNEVEILQRVTEKLGNARIFSLGVGSSVNRFLLDRLAEAGCGVAEYLKPGESPDKLVERFSERITNPVFTQLELNWGGLDVIDVEPRRLPDLFAGQPLLVHARYTKSGRGSITLRGWAGTQRVEVSTRVHLPALEEDNSAQARLWARTRVARLEMEKLGATNAEQITEEITLLALEHRLMTAYTSFVAVDKTEVRTGGDLVIVNQPVPMPEGVSHQGVFGQDRRMSFFGSSSPRVQSELAKSKRVPIPDATPDDPEPIRGSMTGDFIDFMPDGNMVLGIPDAPPPQVEPLLRYVSGGNITKPEKISGAEPSYPEAARKARIEGVIVLELTITRDGSVKDAKVLRGLPLGLSESAVAATSGWRFEPATLDGAPVAVLYILTVRFTLSNPAQMVSPAPITGAPAPLPQPAAVTRPIAPTGQPAPAPGSRVIVQGPQQTAENLQLHVVAEPTSTVIGHFAVTVGFLLLFIVALVFLVVRRWLSAHRSDTAAAPASPH